MSAVRHLLAYVKKTPKIAIVAAVLIPGGVIGLATWLSLKSFVRTMKKKNEKVKSDL
jgi:hypothetical protein